MMTLQYEYNPRYPMRLRDFHLGGLTGAEGVTSMQESLSLMEIQHPLAKYRKDVQSGAYNSLSEEEWKRLTRCVDVLCKLWRDPEHPEKKLGRYNTLDPVTLLQNAITDIIEMSDWLWDYGWYTGNDEEV